MSWQIRGVESFVFQVDSALRQRQEQERLREILSRIESYDAVDAKDEEVERLVRAHCDLDLTKPMPSCSDHQRRHLLHEGDLKLRDQVRFNTVTVHDTNIIVSGVGEILTALWFSVIYSKVHQKWMCTVSYLLMCC